MQNKRPTIAMPPNEVDIKLIFTRRRSAKVMGKLAEAPTATDADDADMEIVDNKEGKDKEAAEPREGESVRGILVTQQNSSKIVAPEDLSTYTPLRVGSVSSRLHVPFVGKVDTLRLFLNEMFRGIDESNDGSNDNDDDDMDGAVTFSMHGGQVSVTKSYLYSIQTLMLTSFPSLCNVILGKSYCWQNKRRGNSGMGLQFCWGCHCRFRCCSHNACSK